MTRTVLIGIAGAVIVTVALALNYTLNETPVSEDTASGEQATEESGETAGAATDDDDAPAPDPAPDAAADAEDAGDDGDAGAADQADAGEDAGDVADAGGGGATGEADATGDAADSDADTETGAETETARADGTGDEAAGTAGGEDTDADETGAAESDRPTFDVVRISKDGDTVIAGRAPPRSEVTILDNETEVGTVTTDARGEWVYLPSVPLEPGSHQLSLRAAPETGEPVESDDKVVLVVPEPGEDIAGRSTDAESKPLALLVPRERSADADDDGAAPDAEEDGGSADSAGDSADDAAPGSGSGGDGQLGARVLQKPSVPGSVESDTGDLALDSVDYDDAGNVSLGGRGMPGTEVRAYLDNRLIGRAEVPPSGLWQIEPDQTVDPGSYTLRLDMVGGDGDVAARVELPFTQSSPARDFSGDSFVVVQPGNNLWRIARRTMDSGFKYTVIYQANKEQIRDPDLIYPGQIFEIPGN